MPFNFCFTILTFILLVSCNSGQTIKQGKTATTITSNVLTLIEDSTDTFDAESANSQMSIVYIVVADTNQDYYYLRSFMFSLHNTLHTAIDTMNRYYNTEKKEIVLSENDEDEMYRGTYFPRRYTSESFSLEYYRQYSDFSTEKNIALVYGIYDTESNANAALIQLKKYSKNAFSLQTTVYMGCMH